MSKTADRVLGLHGLGNLIIALQGSRPIED